MAEIKMAIEAEDPMAQEASYKDECSGTCTHEAETGTSRDDMSLATLIAMVPLLVFTLFGQIGLL